MTADEIEALMDRKMQFDMLQLPGQSMMMHMGTSYLMSDLAAAVRVQHIELSDALSQLAAMRAELIAARKTLLKAKEALGKVIDCDHHNHYDGPEPRSVNIARAALSEIHKLTGEA